MSSGSVSGKEKPSVKTGTMFFPYFSAAATSCRTQSPSLAQRSRAFGERMRMKSLQSRMMSISC